jgi:hypothetical protein
MNKIYTSIKSSDGFGAQYQRVIQTYIFCKIHNMPFLYSPLDSVEHNYNNDITYTRQLEDLMNLEKHIPNWNRTMNVEQLDYGSIVMPFFERNIDKCCNSEHMHFIKNCYWQNKTKNYFNNDNINVAIHIRRENLRDNGQAGARATTPNRYYLNIMNAIRDKYNPAGKELLFHIYSQGQIEQFAGLNGSDVKFYLNYDIVETFKGMVSAEILVISPSSLSYVAALISDGEVHYKRFWHNPKQTWIKYD